MVPFAAPCADPNQIKYSYVSNEMDGWMDGYGYGWVDEWIYDTVNGWNDG